MLLAFSLINKAGRIINTPACSGRFFSFFNEGLRG